MITALRLYFWTFPRNLLWAVYLNNLCTDWSQDINKFGQNKCTTKFTKVCIKDVWNARVACEKWVSQCFESLTKFHDFSRLFFFSNPWFFPDFWSFFKIPWLFQVWKRFCSYSRFPWFFQRLETLIKFNVARRTKFVSKGRRGSEPMSYFLSHLENIDHKFRTSGDIELYERPHRQLP